MIRICCVNYELIISSQCEYSNDKMLKYLEQQIVNPQLCLDTTPQDLLNHCQNRNTSYTNIFNLIWQNWKNHYRREVEWAQESMTTWNKLVQRSRLYCWMIGMWFVLPMFMVSRMFYLAFPIIAAIEEFKYYYVSHDEKYQDPVIHEMLMFQIALLVAYYCLVIVWIVSFVNVWQFYYWTRLLGVGRENWYFEQMNDQKQTMNIVKRYDKIFNHLTIVALVKEYFGSDIGSVVLKYYECIQL